MPVRNEDSLIKGVEMLIKYLQSTAKEIDSEKENTPPKIEEVITALIGLVRREVELKKSLAKAEENSNKEWKSYMFARLMDFNVETIKSYLDDINSRIEIILTSITDIHVRNAVANLIAVLGSSFEKEIDKTPEDFQERKQSR